MPKAKEKQTFTIWKGLPNEVEISEDTCDLFWRANQSGKRGSLIGRREILALGLEEIWIQWNHETSTHLHVLGMMCNYGYEPNDPNWQELFDSCVEHIGSTPHPEMRASCIELLEKAYDSKPSKLVFVEPPSPKKPAADVWECGYCHATLPKGDLGSESVKAIAAHFMSHTVLEEKEA
jgi:hypothetical protein